MLKKFGSFGLIAVVVSVIFLGVFASKVGTNVDDAEILVTQDAYDGDITVYNTGGFKWIWFAGKIGYLKRGQLEFAPPVNKDNVSTVSLDSEEAKAYGLRLRFNDKGGATLYSQFSYTMPNDKDLIKKIRAKYPSEAAMERDLIRPVITKAVYMTGPTMSSEESTAVKRSELIGSIMDQINNGPYLTENIQTKIEDTLSGKMKTVTVAQIVEDPNSPNGRARQEVSPLKEFGIVVLNPEIKKIKYDGQVEDQIEAQRKITMDIQTAVAKTKEAEQNAIRAVEEGKANTATAKWAQETENAKDIALAEKNKTVAKLAKEAAKFTKDKDILLGQGEAERKRLVMQADGALEKKLATYEKVMASGFDAMKNYAGNWVSQIDNRKFGSGADNAGGSGQGAFEEMAQTLSIKALKDLGLDMTISGNAKK